jgi:hypothetical protein
MNYFYHMYVNIVNNYSYTSKLIPELINLKVYKKCFIWYKHYIR